MWFTVISLVVVIAGVSEEDSKKLDELAENLDLEMVETSESESESTSNASSSSELIKIETMTTSVGWFL